MSVRVVQMPGEGATPAGAITGGLLLGFGALINGGCYLGSVLYLGSGNLNFLLTLVGIAGGEFAGSLASGLASLPGVSAPRLAGPFFKEFVVDFGGTERTVAEVNEALRERGIFGGRDLSSELPEFGQSALYCVTEVHTQADIDRLAHALREVVA